jgi:hypothetical protein
MAVLRMYRFLVKNGISVHLDYDIMAFCSSLLVNLCLGKYGISARGESRAMTRFMC